MTIEQQYRELKKSKHLWCLMPKGKYLEIVLQAQALLEQMGRELEELGSEPVRKMPRKAPNCPPDEREAKRTALASSGQEIVVPGAFSAEKAS